MKTYWVTFDRTDVDDVHIGFSVKVSASNRKDARRKAHKFLNEDRTRGAWLITGFRTDW